MPEKTLYEKMQDLWVKEVGLKVGDIILLGKKPVNTFDSWSEEWTGAMTNESGCKYPVSKITPRGIQTKNCTCCFFPFTAITKEEKDERPQEYYPKNQKGFFVARDSIMQDCWMWPADEGLLKCKGCVEWGRVETGDTLDNDCNNAIRLTEEQCKKLFLDFPGDEEAWLVTPTKDGWDWTDETETVRFLIE